MVSIHVCRVSLVGTCCGVRRLANGLGVDGLSASHLLPSPPSFFHLGTRILCQQSTNPFAALDDSGDEAPPAKVVEKKAAKPKAPPKVAEPSKVDQKYVVVKVLG